MAGETLIPVPDKEALNASIAAYESGITAYEGAVEIYNEARRQAYRLRDEADAKHSGLYVARDELLKEREGLLRAQLESEGLAICSEEVGDSTYPGNRHDRNDGTIWESPDPLRKYGVHPKAEMTMVYSASTYEVRINRGYFDDFETRQDTSFGIYCPDHTSLTKENYSRPSKFGDKYGSDEWTRVIENDGKLVRELDGQEVTKLLTQGRINPDLYSHFNFPQIPELPEAL